jgi:hypothetical protein
MLALYDLEHIMQWLKYLQNAKKFIDWFYSVKLMLKNKKKNELTSQIIFKLREIIEFCNNFSEAENVEMPQVTYKEYLILQE